MNTGNFLHQIDESSFSQLIQAANMGINGFNNSKEVTSSGV